MKHFGPRHGFKKFKKYDEGGEVEGISGTAGRSGPERGAGQRTSDDMTFSQAFRAARNADKNTFMWRGNKYTTETKEEKAAREEAAKERDEPTANFQTQGRNPTVDFKTEGRASSESSKTDKLTEQRAAKLSAPTKGGPTGRRGERKASTASDEPKSKESDKPRLRERIRSFFEEQKKLEKAKRGYNNGGKIDGCAIRGKTRGKLV